MTKFDVRFQTLRFSPFYFLLKGSVPFGKVGNGSKVIIANPKFKLPNIFKKGDFCFIFSIKRTNYKRENISFSFLII